MTHKNTHWQMPICALKPLARALALICALGAPFGASAQVAPIPFETEGVVTNIHLQPDGSGVDLTVFGRVMHVPKGATIHTPTATLSLEQLADPAQFPGLNRNGFVGSTVILTGEVNVAPDGTATPVIADVTIEPAETVLLGALTQNNAGALALLGVPMAESTDPRLPSKGYRNEFGFPVQPATIPVGTFAALEGYYGDDGVFRHFSVEAAGGTLVDANAPQTSITRTNCVPGSRLLVHGASYLPAGATIAFRNPKTNYLFGSVNTSVDLEFPEFGTYRYDVVVNEGEVDSDGACPSVVLAVNLTNNTQATSVVDGVVAPAPADPTPTANAAPVAVADAASVFVGLATEVHLTANDSDANGNMDNTTVQLIGVPPGLAVQNLQNGDVVATADAAGTYTFSYTVADTDGLVSSAAAVTITAQPVTMDTVAIGRSNYRADTSRWEIRGTTNQAGAQITAVLMRTNETIALVTSDATGGWQIDVRNSPISAVAGDVLRVISSGGGNDQEPVNIVR